MPSLYLQRNNNGPETTGETPVTAAFAFRGETVQIPMAPELPCTILPRLSPVSVDGGQTHPLTGRFQQLVQTGQIPPGMRLAPQHIEYRGRSINLLDPDASSIYVVQGFGFGEDRTRKGSPEIVFDIPKPDVNIADYDQAIDTNMRMGTRYISRDGSLITVPNITPLGGITQETLLTKIANTEKAGKMLEGLAIVPEWLTYGVYQDLPIPEGQLAWGVYSLPLHLPSYQLAEISRFFTLKGSENSLFTEYIFKTFKALRCLHNKDYVHGQPHKGNLHAAFDNSGHIWPIITDWTTMYYIGKHRSIYRSSDDAFTLPARQQACAIDFNTALATLLEAHVFFQLSADQRVRNWLIGLNPLQNISVADYMHQVSQVTSAAVLGYILPGDYEPDDYSFLDAAENGIGAIFASADLTRKSLMDLNFRKYAVQIGDDIMRACKPGGKRDEIYVQAINAVRDNFLMHSRIDKMQFRNTRLKSRRK